VDIDDLYGAPLEQFVPERTALVRELRKQGRRDDAATVAALRKPSVAAWAVNQLVRTQVKSINELFGAGDALRKAHDNAASGGGDASALRDAARRQRDAVDTLIEAARGLLSSEGHELSPATIDRVTETLQAAALEEDARARVQEGRLERELRHVGLGLGGAFAAEPAPAKQEPKAKSKPKPKNPKKPKRDVERERKLKAAKTAEATARRELDRSRRAVESAQVRRDRAAEALEDAEQALAEAETRTREAEQVHQRTSDQLERI
jgi:DNA repair exonuclease SbcCD ATPase subunit